MRKGILFFVLLLLLLGANLLWGSVPVPLKELFSSQILWQFRLPKALTALLAGMALSVSGVQMQTLFRNPLADPYVLGISAGAGLGVALFVMGQSVFGIDVAAAGDSIWAGLSLAGAAYLGALGVTAFIMAAAKRIKNSLSLLVLGIMIGMAGSALIGLLQYASAAPALKTYVLWTMGSFANVTGNRLALMAVLTVAGLLLSFYNSKDLNVLLMGELYARSLGVRLSSVRNRILAATALLAGTVTAFCGPIGFVGIAVPHVARRLLGTANHRRLLPGAMLLGGGFMLLANLLSQLPWTQGVLPVNTVAALLGIPFIIALIFKSTPLYE